MWYRNRLDLPTAQTYEGIGSEVLWVLHAEEFYFTFWRDDSGTFRCGPRFKNTTTNNRVDEVAQYAYGAGCKDVVFDGTGGIIHYDLRDQQIREFFGIK